MSSNVSMQSTVFSQSLTIMIIVKKYAIKACTVQFSLELDKILKVLKWGGSPAFRRIPVKNSRLN